ncbi:MAG: HDOD domain-containing protein [Spirochaetes bacterium]|nr:HDOD domain-containing protein [Spirochaetota bacterium]
MDKLPSMPLLYGKLQKLLQDPKSSMDDIAHILSSDPAMTMSLLRLVNSAAFGLRVKVTNIKSAATFLGLRAIASLLSGLSVVRAFGQTKASTLFNPAQFWVHSLGVGFTARRFAQVLDVKDTEGCFLGGMLHDVGRLVLSQHLTEDFTKALLAADRTNTLLLEQEEAVFGFSHCDVGLYLADAWNLPDELRLAIAWHHKPHLLPKAHLAHQKLVTIVGKANQVCIHQAVGASGETRMSPPHAFSAVDFKACDLTGTVETVKSDIQATFAELQKIMG